MPSLAYVRQTGLLIFPQICTCHPDQHVYDEGVPGCTYLQILARMSPLPVAKSSPVGQGATEMTAVWHVSGCNGCHDHGGTNLNSCVLEA